MTTQEEKRAFDRQLREKLEKDRKPSRLERYKTSIQAGLAKAWQRFDCVAQPIARGATWVAPKLAHGVEKVAVILSCKKDEDGKRHFDGKYFGLNIIKIGLVIGVIYFFSTPIYYYGTWTTYENVYVPSAGVYVNQQYVDPSAPGQAIAPRDEIYTVLGHTLDPHGTVEPIRFDIDANLWFWFYGDSLRPDLAAAKLTSQSPYGVKCSVEATGFYNRLPRYVRLWALKWWDFRPEIVKIIKVEELKSSPEEFQNR